MVGSGGEICPRARDHLSPALKRSLGRGREVSDSHEREPTGHGSDI
jgi:hypothetical protein